MFDALLRLRELIRVKIGGGKPCPMEFVSLDVVVWLASVADDEGVGRYQSTLLKAYLRPVDNQISKDSTLATARMMMIPTNQIQIPISAYDIPTPTV